MSDDHARSGILNLSYENERRLFSVLKRASAVIAALIGLFPIYWMLQVSLKTREAALSPEVSWLPTIETFTVQAYEVLLNPDIVLYFFNTVVVTLGTIFMVVIISLIAGYGLARLEFPQKRNFARALLLGYLFSPIVLGLPLYLIWRSIGLLNTRVGLIVALSALSMPFAVWLMWKYIQTIPESMEERAWMAGASRWRGFRDVVVPQTYPAIIAASLFAFAIAWNDFTFAQILLPRNEATTFAPGIFRLVQRGYDVSQTQVMAVSFVMTVPPLIFAYFMQSYLLKGFEIRQL